MTKATALKYPGHCRKFIKKNLYDPRYFTMDPTLPDSFHGPGLSPKAERMRQRLIKDGIIKV
ncbi:hypothetical protein [Chitinophaga tropicalis]|uniref:Uncharacterized protein n=1 Tax=Chitinophaga tropicalis TaxID=2683588 RepID=A0A7K1U6D8_9BACT|nr:hypothetical protein [Chitinophaga tropicalis]MVT09924.1 hypothetical protein [Chitinophaga tropicalis]